MSRIIIKDIDLQNSDGRYEREVNITIEDSKITEISTKPPDKRKGDEVIEGKGLTAFPSFIDMHAHFREPGYEYKENIESGSLAAIKGGFTAVCIMPNTNPIISSPQDIEYILSPKRNPHCDIYAIASISTDSKCNELAPMSSTKEAGAIAFTNDGIGCEDLGFLYRALKYIKMIDSVYIHHSEIKSLSKGGVMNESALSTRLGLKGIPSEAEDISTISIILLNQIVKAKLHIAHVSSAISLEFIAWGKRKGIPVSAETTPHHFSLTEEELISYDANYKMYPPLRTKKDKEAIISAIKNDTIDVIATDHAPHALFEKRCEIEIAPFGVIGLETAFPVCFTYLVKPGHISLSQLLQKIVVNPAKILNLPINKIEKGMTANIVLIDLKERKKITSDFFVSKSQNSPFIGKTLYGFPKITIYKGNIVYKEI